MKCPNCKSIGNKIKAGSLINDYIKFCINCTRFFKYTHIICPNCQNDYLYHSSDNIYKCLICNYTN